MESEVVDFRTVRDTDRLLPGDAAIAAEAYSEHVAPSQEPTRIGRADGDRLDTAEIAGLIERITAR